jgi:gliding motility-associated-like protein
VVINVLDTLAPIARCRDLTVFLNNGGFVQVNATDINAPAPNASSDNCGIFSYRINGSNFVFYDCSSVASNPNLAVLTIQDIYGNVDTCQSRITVRDTIGPNVVCQNLVINLSSAGPRTLTPADLDPGNATSDACGVDTMYVVPSLITCNDVGNIPVTLYALDVNGNLDSCTAIATVILDGPSPTATTPLCEGDNLNLFTNPPATGLTYTYNWSGPNNFAAAVQNPVINGVTGAATGLYTITITPTNGTGCPASDTVSVYVNVVPEPILAASTSICEGGNGFIFLQNASSYTGTNFSYQWALGGGAISNNSDTLFLSGLSQANAGNYTLTITVDGCSDNNSATPFNLVVNTLPPAPQPTVNNPCAGEDLNFLANPQDTANRTYTFAWSGPAGFNSSLENPSLAAVNQTNAGLYSLTVSDNNTCTATATVTASIRPVPAAPTLQYNAPLCLGDVLELTDGTSHMGSPLNFVWTLPDLTSTTTTTPQLLLNNAQAGLYRLQVSLNGCFSVVDTETVNYQPLPLANDDALTVPFRDSLLAVTVIANDVLPINGYTISIIQAPTHGSLVNNANGTFDYRPHYSHFGLDTFRYAICDVLCGNSCDTATVFINVTTDFECFIPNAISPNGDGINDVLNIRCVNSYPNAEVQIFTRWGTRVYSGPMAGFNGQFNGNDLPDGTYFYVLKLNDRSHVSNDQYSGYLIIQR